MVDPITIALSNTLGLAGKSQGAEAAIAMTAQGANLANSMVKANRVTDAQAARAAENAEVATNNRLKPRLASKRNKNFPQPKQRSLGIEDSQAGDSEGFATDAVWKTSGAQIINAPDQGPQGRNISDPWSIATSARRLDQIDTDYVGRHLNLAA